MVEGPFLGDTAGAVATADLWIGSARDALGGATTNAIDNAHIAISGMAQPNNGRPHGSPR
ncbi:hypothetical protein DMH01_38170 [Amycolatopsis sp. WAC 04182]|nr:hypothetical protein DMH01_38170 [Amycolatopsis sp. WAC 04182]